MKKIELEKVVAFMDMLHRLQGVTRVMHVPNEDRFENDLEHSYLLAMAVWYAIDTFDLSLDRDKAIRYALTHDMPEVHAGDTYVFTTDAALLAGKKEREANARKQLAEEFPTVPAMHEAMQGYEEQVDEEAVFVRAFDKVMPLLTNYLQDGRTFKYEKLSFSQLADKKRATTAKSPEVADVVEQILALFDKDRARYFGDNLG